MVMLLIECLNSAKPSKHGLIASNFKILLLNVIQHLTSIPSHIPLSLLIEVIFRDRIVDSIDAHRALFILIDGGLIRGGMQPVSSCNSSLPSTASTLYVASEA